MREAAALLSVGLVTFGTLSAFQMRDNRRHGRPEAAGISHMAVQIAVTFAVLAALMWIGLHLLGPNNNPE